MSDMGQFSMHTPRWWQLASVAVLASLVGSALASAADPLKLLPAGGRFDYQLGGAYPPAAAVTIVARDRGAAPAEGLYSICYVNAFQTQPEEAAWWRKNHPDLLLRTEGGGEVEDKNWQGEYLFDTSTAEKRAALMAVIGPWIDGCAASRFAAVEPDNLNSWTRSDGKLTMAHNLEMAKLIAERAHANRLAVAQKNAVEIGAEGKAFVGFDFAMAELCQQYDECDAYAELYGDQMIEIEYTDTDRSYFEKACAARGDKIPIALKDRDLVPPGQPAHHFELCRGA